MNKLLSIIKPIIAILNSITSDIIINLIDIENISFDARDVT